MNGKNFSFAVSYILVKCLINVNAFYLSDGRCIRFLSVPGMQSNPRTIEEPVPMVENSVGDSPPSQSHLQDLLLHASDIAVS